MGIQIDRIKFENYRQYGTTEINFVPDPQVDTKLFAFIAQNGTGKTTLLKAITWCLYGADSSGASKNSKSLPLVNTTTLFSSPKDEKIPVSVAFRFTDEEENTIEFTRKTFYKMTADNSFIKGPDIFSVTTTPINGKNTQTLQSEQADLFLKKYFDAAISNFYFFDGEKLAKFFKTELKDSIYNIAQVHMLGNTIKHIGVVKRELNKKIGKQLPAIQEKQNQIDSKTRYIEGLNGELRQVSLKLRPAKDAFEKAKEAIRGYRPVQELQKKREKLLGEQAEIEKGLEKLKSEKVVFIQQYLTLLHLYPRIKKVADYISSKAQAGKLPPSIDRAQIISLLENIKQHMEQECPMCGHHLSEADKAHLESVLGQCEISSATSNFLSKMQGPLEIAIKLVKEYPKKRDEILERSKALRKKESVNKKELDVVNADFANAGGEAGQARASELNAQYNRASTELISLKAAKMHHEEELQKANRELAELKQEMEGYQEKQNIEKKARDQFAVLSKLEKSFELVRDEIVNETKAEMQKLTWETFSSMTWKEHTFDRIDIDDDYNVTLYNAQGLAMNLDASATEGMALAYAFTLSVHQVSGQNSPLVIDSPLGRVSDDNREKMAAVLLAVAKEKQIIMLFTPDEYSEQVRKLYENHATIRQLKLSAKENFLEEVKPYGR